MTTPALADLRREIDRIDEAMHRLLIERGEIIDRLIAAKRTTESGSAFRPDREAAIMRALVARHRGNLPLSTVEGIWRVIVSTFTHLQAPYTVHGDVSGPDGSALRDSARFHFGFAVPFSAQPSAEAVIEAVARSRGDLGLVRASPSASPWWQLLERPGDPKIIARLPFLDRPEHPAPEPLFVVSRPVDAPAAEIFLWSTGQDGDLPGDGPAVVARWGRNAALVSAGSVPPVAGARPVGSHARPVSLA